MNYRAYLAQVDERLSAQGFQATSLSEEMQALIGLLVERAEPWGRLVIALSAAVNLTDAEQRERVVAAAGGWVRNQPPNCHLILLFPFDRRVAEAESEAIRRLRQNGPEGRWSVIPWTADLDVELLVRHTGFPPVPNQVVQALTEVPRGTVERTVRQGVGTRLFPRRWAISLDEVPVTRVILATTVAYYLWVSLMDGMGSLSAGFRWLLAGPDIETSLRWGANYGYLVFLEGQQWRVLSHLLLHGGLWHLGLNMWALWALGRHAEMVYGSRRMLFIYIVAGMSGGLASTVFRPEFVPSVGASGAIFGLFGALIYWGASFKNRPVNWHGLWGPVAVNLLIGFFLPFIDNYGHVGGLIGGALAGFLAGAPGERQPWRTAAMGLVGLVLLLVLTGVIRLPHLGSAREAGLAETYASEPLQGRNLRGTSSRTAPNAV